MWDGEPPQQLRGFVKLALAAGESAVATFALRTRDLSVWDVDQHGWQLQTGTFDVAVGSSSRDIRLRGSFAV